MYKKGFVCSYYLMIFLIVTVFVSVLIRNISNRIRLTMNVNNINSYLSEEAAVLSFIRCEYANGRTEYGTFRTSGIHFSADADGDCITVIVYDPVPEIIRISLKDGYVFDYDTVRNLKPA